MEIWKDLQLIRRDFLETPDNEALRKSVPFDEMPGPLLLRHIAQAWRYLPVMGSQVTTGALQYLLNAGKILGKFSSNHIL